MSRVRSDAPGKQRGVLVINEGGPGPHLQDASAFGSLAPRSLLAAYDVVSFDQRGFGRSAPVSCALSPEEQAEIPPWPQRDGAPASPAQARQVAAKCAAHAGGEMPFLGTANVARDLDRIRAALGVSKISYLGISYGSYLGTAYASMYPRHTDRVLLDSDVNPAIAWRGLWHSALTTGVNIRFPGFARFAAARNDGYGLGTTQANIERTFLNVVRQRDRHPLRTPSGTVTGTQLRIALYASMYNDAAFAPAAAFIKAARDGDIAAAARAGDQLQVWFSDENTAAGQLGVFCADQRWPRSVPLYEREARADARRYPLTGGAGSSIWPCAFWASRPAGPPVRASADGPDNILLINNLRDPATLYADAQRLRRQFGGRARLVGVDHGGHGSYLLAGNQCADEAGTAFLLGGPLPARDFTCPANHPGKPAHAGLRAALTHLTAADGVVGALAEVRDATGTADLSSGVADAATRRPLRADDGFRIFSNTKTFVATVMLQLAAEGRIRLTDTVERYLPGLIRGHGNDGRDITIRELLQHTSGLPDYNPVVFDPGQYYRHRLDHYTPVQLVHMATSQPRLSQPGTAFHYSTTNYIVAGMIIERVTGHNWVYEVRQRILRPLGLRNTYSPGNSPVIHGPHAEGYAHLDEHNQISDHGRLIDVTPMNPSVVWAGGDMISTVSDLNTFFGTLLRGRLLPARQLAEMETTVPADLFPGSRYGLGLISAPLSCGGRYWAHGGDGLGYQTREGNTPDGRQVTIMHTSSPSTQRQFDDTLKAVDTALCESVPR